MAVAPDVNDEPSAENDEPAEVAFEREFAARVEEELQEGEEELAGELEEDVVAASSPETAEAAPAQRGAPRELAEILVGEPSIDLSSVVPELEEPVATGTAKENPHGPGEDEFVCRSCFLVKRRNQLADPKRELCADCV